MNLDNKIIKQQEASYDTYLKIKNNPRYTKIWKYLKDNNISSGKLLDIGCTDGEFSAPLIEIGFDCYGLEFMDKAIEESTQKGIKVTKGSFIEDFPFADNTFDIVFGGEVIEHTTDDSYFLSETNRVLKDGGILIITTPNLVSFGNRLLMLLGKLPRFAYAEFHYRIYNKALITRKIESSGFKVIKTYSNYILMSRFFNKYIGIVGEFLGTYLPSFGENFIVISKKTSTFKSK